MADAPAWVTRLISPPECRACHQPGAVALHQILDQGGFIAAQWRCTACGYCWRAVKPQ